MLRNVFLYGKLKDLFGEVWELDVESIGEAVHAININTNGKFSETIKEMMVRVVRGEDLDSGEVLDEDLIKMNYGKGDFHIVPAVAGAGGAVLAGFIIGALVIGAIVAFTMPTVRPEDNFEAYEKGYEFQNIGNATTQGMPVPLIYGEVYTGSIVISQGIKSEEVPVEN